VILINFFIAMKFIQNLSIRNKLLLICLVPLIATLYFLTAGMLGEISKRKNLQQVNTDLQEERSNSVAALNQLLKKQGKQKTFSGFNIQLTDEVNKIYHVARGAGKQGIVFEAIQQIDERETVTPETVYLAPPGYHLLIEKDKTFSRAPYNIL
jgi:hypothetical protein